MTLKKLKGKKRRAGISASRPDLPLGVNRSQGGAMEKEMPGILLELSCMLGLKNECDKKGASRRRR